MQKKFLSIFLVSLIISLSYLFFAFAFTEPTATPPNNNVPAPINVSATTQTKQGGLNVAINSGTYLGIGTATPDYKLTVMDGANLGNIKGILNAGYISAGQFGQYTGGGIFSFPGNVGIGTAAPGTKLDVAGIIRASGNYYNVVSWNYNGTPSNGVKIKTNIPYTNGSQMPTIIIEGYDYGRANPIGISLVWYVYGGNFISYKASSWGNTTPTIKLANENGYVTIWLDWRPYYGRMTVRAYAQGMSETPSWFNGWTVVDEPAGTTNQVTVPYENTFPGTVNFASGIWNSSGNVGIGTTTPAYKLTVAGDIYYTGQIIGPGGSVGYWIQSGSNLYPNNTSWNVGIGTTGPGAKLDVAGSARISGDIDISGSNRWIIHSPDDGRTTLYIAPWGTTDWNWGAQTQFANNGNVYFSGNVGIGTTGPSAKLHVSGGDIMLNNIWMREYNSGTAIGFGYGSSGAQVYTGKLSVGYNYGTAAPSNSLIVYGNVGIGNTSPSYKLDVSGDARVTGTLYAGTVSGNYTGTINAANVSAGQFGANTGGGTYSFPGNVGIGTTAPMATLHVVNPSTSAGALETILSRAIGDNNFWIVTKKGVTTNNSGDITSKFGLSYMGTTDNAFIRFHRGGSSTGGFISFSTNNDTEVVRITASGNVGIGTTNPAHKLDIATGAANVKTYTYGLETTVNTTGGWARSMRFRNENDNVTAAFGSLNGNAYIATGFDINADATGYQTQRLTVTTAGNVGIGNTSPSYKLDVSGDARVTGTLYAGTVSGNYTGTINAANVSAGQFASSTGGGNFSFPGNVGIGTTAPQTKLDVYQAGTTGWAGRAIVRNENVAALMGVYNNVAIVGAHNAALTAWSPLYLNTDNALSGYGNVIIGGNVGIGTTAPGYKLDVSGDVRWTGILQGGSVPWARLTSFPSGCPPGQFVTAVGGSLTCTAPPSGISGSGSTNYIPIWTGSTSLGNSVIYQNGSNVGIGTTAPENSAGWNRVLDVYGNPHSRIITRTSNIRTAFTSHNSGFFGAPAGGIIGTETSHPLSFITGGSSRVTIDTSGNVGIGTTAPSAKLEVSSSDYPVARFVRTTTATGGVANGWQLLAISSGTMTFGFGGGLRFAIQGSGTSINDIAQIAGIRGNQDNSGQLAFSVANQGTMRNAMTIDQLGNVGIGTTTPGTTLDVNGTIRANKLTAGVIDPIYEIEGKKYITYVSDFAGGLRTETSGILQLKTKNNQPQAVIDFDNLEKGSDLWIFWQTSNKEIKDLVVLLTSSFEGKVWYNKDGNKLIILGDKEGEVSYRFTLPRFDAKDWPNEEK